MRLEEQTMVGWQGKQSEGKTRGGSYDGTARNTGAMRAKLEQMRKEADERRAAREARTAQEQIEVLDVRGATAARERARLVRLIQNELNREKSGTAPKAIKPKSKRKLPPSRTIPTAEVKSA
jgi:hypothetical protein